MLDDATGDILWLKFSSSQDSENIVLCVCYLPPSESTRVNDSELFYATLLEHVYSYQNEARIIMCGDFNSRVGEATEFIEGVDDVTPRNVMDYTSNVNGDLLIEFLVDCGMCLVNGRVGNVDFTHVSHRGKSVVPYEQLAPISDFCVIRMTDLVNILNCRGVTKVPDHSILIWNITGCANKGQVPMSASVHSAPKLTNIPSSFLNDETSLDQVVAVIDRIERDLEINRDVNNAYDSFKDLVFSEMDRKLPKRSRKFSNGNKTAMSFHNPLLVKNGTSFVLVNEIGFAVRGVVQRNVGCGVYM